jgi:Na+/H+ antiporter NhaD/arsenite permease-like protein
MQMRAYVLIVWGWICRERFLVALLFLFPILWLLSATPIQNIPALVHWHTIAALSGLVVLSAAVQWSGVVVYLSHQLLRKIQNERLLAAVLCFISAALAAVITNDVALFLTIPLTLTLARIATLPVLRLVVFQALAVNAGSALSPIGNPQNIFLWQISELSLLDFALAMLPMAIPFVVVLSIAVLIAFKSRPLELSELAQKPCRIDSKLFWPTLALYPVFLYALDYGKGWIASLILIIVYGFWQKRRLFEIDWALLLLFVMMFVNIGLLVEFSLIHTFAELLLQLPGAELSAGTLLSQLISNVPAAIFLEPFCADWKRLAWGVNIGGFGLALGSLANLIALRLARQPGLFVQFHCWSIPCLIFTFLLSVLLLN